MFSSSFFKKVAVMLCAAIFFACNDKMDDLNSNQGNQEIEQEISAITEKGTFVSSEQAKEVAEAFFSRHTNEGAIVKISMRQHILSILLNLPIHGISATVLQVHHPVIHRVHFLKAFPIFA